MTDRDRSVWIHSADTTGPWHVACARCRIEFRPVRTVEAAMRLREIHMGTLRHERGWQHAITEQR